MQKESCRMIRSRLLARVPERMHAAKIETLKLMSQDGCSKQFVNSFSEGWI